MKNKEKIKLLETNQVDYKESIQQLEKHIFALAEYNKEKIELLEARISDLEVFTDYTIVKQIVKQHERSNEMISKKPELIGIPFQLDKFGHVVFKDKRINPDAFFNYFIDENIDQSNIKGILIEMKEPKK